MLMIALYPQAHASVVRDDVDYQIYRDFSENKGAFYPGALNISIHDVNGNLVDILDKAPMPDFSSVNTFGIATLVNPQYLASVNHNDAFIYRNVYFGGRNQNPDYHRYNYTLVNRNPHPSLDFHLPRLDKIVTEVIPAEMNKAGPDDFSNNKRFPVFYRIGGGNQFSIMSDGTFTHWSNAYHYLTGGTISSPYNGVDVFTISSDVSDPLADTSGPLWNRPQEGDSGSPLFGWDALQNKWLLTGVADTVTINAAAANNLHAREVSWLMLPLDFINSLINSNIDPIVDFSNSKSDIHWTFDNSSGLGDLSKDGTHYSMYGVKDGDLNAGKDLIFIGSNGTIILDTSIDQGAGTLTFNTDYIVRPSGDETWKGGGIIVNDDKTVTWQVNGVAGDSLHKIGTGTLKVNATGENPGELSVGDGTVVLNQQADPTGKKQAFSKIDIVSGRPTVVLNDGSQIDPNNIYFGFRGGRLDLNGNALSFKRIRNADNGAQLVNHNDMASASVTVTGYGVSDLNLFDVTDPAQVDAILYINDERIKFNIGVIPGEDKQIKINSTLSEINKIAYQGFLGESDPTKINGKMDFTFTPVNASAIMALTGGSNMNGTLTVDNGTVLLSGQPVPHAEKNQLLPSGQIDPHANDPVVVDDDWYLSEFTIKDIHISKNADFQVGEYAHLRGNIYAGENTRTVLGYYSDNSQPPLLWRCYVDPVEITGSGQCSRPSRNDTQFEVLPPSVVTGDITLADNATLSLGKVTYTGHLDGSASSVVSLGRDSLWNMTEDSRAGTLNLEQGSQMTFSPFPHTLTVSNLTGHGGTINLNTALAGSSSPSDKIIINGGAASGHTLLQVHNQGGLGAQTSGDGIQLVEAIHGGTTARDAFNMPGELVAGAWRYNLYRKSGDEGWYLTTDKLSLAMTPLTPAKVTVPMTSLTPAKVTIPMTSLTPAIVTIQAPVNDLQQGQNITNDSHVKVSTDQSVNWSGSLNGQGMLTKEGAGNLTLENSQVAQTGGVMLNAGNLILSGTKGTFDVVAKEGTGISLTNHSVLTGTVDPTDLSVDSSSVWNITGDSLLNAFRNDGVVTFVPPAPGTPFAPHTLTVSSLSGQGGTINLNTRLEGSEAPTDRLVIDGGAATGHTRLVVHNEGGLGAATTGNGIQLVSAVNGGTTADDAFDMPDKLAAGSWRYSLWRNPADAGWYLTSGAVGKAGNEWVRSGHPDYSDAAWSFAGLTTQAMSYERLIANIGDSRTEEGMWSRVEGGRLHQGQDVGSTPSGDAAGETNYSVIQVGGDIGSVETPTSRWRVGLYGATAQTRGHSGRDNGEQAGSVSDQIFSTGAYVHGQYPHGLYVDGQVQVSRHRLNVSLNDSHGRLTTRGTGLNLSTTAGRELHAGGMDITPQAQYRVQSLRMDSEVDTAGTRYDAETATRQEVQAGVKVAHTFAGTGKEDKSVRVWMMPSVLQSFGQRGNTQVGVDGRDETTVTFGPGSEGAAAGVDVGIESHISQQGKVNPDVLVGVRGRYQRGLSGSEQDGVGGQVTFKMMF